MDRPTSYVDASLSLAHLCELETPPADLIEFAARAGFASVGLRVSAASPGGIEYPLRTGAERTELRRRMAATGVSVLYIELISLSETTRARGYRAMFDTGAALGASRLAVAGDSADFAVVAERLAEICDLARSYGIEVDLEFMPFRAVRSLGDAVDVVRRAGRPNAHILIDALHVFRSGSSLEEVARLDPATIGTFQICDAPRVPPPPSELVVEARTRRLLPGQGELDLWPLIGALPADIPIGVEVPLAGQYPNLDAAARMALLVGATRKFLSNR
ncbi:MAG: sugar phosphate isomerase/epimerase family protein [Hyphomicrobiaceae bacterium]